MTIIIAKVGIKKRPTLGKQKILNQDIQNVNKNVEHNYMLTLDISKHRNQHETNELQICSNNKYRGSKNFWKSTNMVNYNAYKLLIGRLRVGNWK